MLWTGIKELFIGKKGASASWHADAAHVQGYNATREKHNHDSFCYAPSVNMLFSTDGSVKACCHNKDFSIGKYPEMSIADMWRGEKAGAFRERMRRFDLTEGCRVCEADLVSGNYLETSARHFDTMPRHEAYPTMMEFWLSNTCNLECVMCTGELSSSIRQHREKLPPLKSPYDSTFVKQLEEFIPHLKETRFSSSGEAFLIPLNFEIWERIIDLNPDCLIMVQTNGTVLNSHIKDLLARGNFKIGVSMDSLRKERYEAIRVNANYERVMDNIRFFNSYNTSKGHSFNISTCVMRSNWDELPDFVRFCNELNCEAIFHKVWFPEEHALYNLTKAELQQLHEQLAQAELPATNALQSRNRRHYQYFVSVIKQWMEQADVVKERAELPVDLPLHDLLNKLSAKFNEHLTAQKRPAQEIEEINAVTRQKLAAIVEAAGDEHAIAAFHKMYHSPTDMVLGALRNRPVEFFITQINKSLQPAG